MVLSFAEDPLEGASNSPCSALDPGTSLLSVGDDSSVGTNSVNNKASIAPSDEESLEVIPRDPHFLSTPVDDTAPAQAQNKLSYLRKVVPPKLNQSHGKSLPSRTLAKQSDIFNLPLPYLPKITSADLYIPLVDWSDLFCSKLHFRLCESPKIWSTFLLQLSNIMSLANFQKLLDCNLKDRATAFLGTDRHSNITLIHNLRLLPGSGTLFSPTPHFLCLTRSSFTNNPPHLLDSEDFDKILQQTTISGIPTHAEILQVCLKDNNLPRGATARPAGTTPDFPLNTMTWKSLTSAPALAHLPGQDPHELTCASIVPVPPILAPHLIDYFESGQEKNRKSPASVAAFVFATVHKIWVKSLDQKHAHRETKFPVDCDYTLWIADILRFLWASDHKKIQATPIIFEVPHDLKQVVNCFHSAIKNIFPDALPAFLLDHHHKTLPNKLAIPCTNPMNLLIPRNPNPFHNPGTTNPSNGSQTPGNNQSGVFPNMLFFTQKVSKAITHQSTMLKAHEDWKDHFKSLPIHTR
ncbi:hypothetical protein ACA910_021561 [Epithemia clementina (nom. ined.)]